MTKALALARAFHRAGHRVVLVESPKYRWTGHRFSRAVDASTPCPSPDAPDYTRRAGRDRPRRGGRRLRPRLQPAREPLRRAGQGGAVGVLRGPPRRRRGDRPARRQVRVRDDRGAGSTCRSPTPTGSSPTPRSRGFDFAGRAGTYIMKSIAYDPVQRLDLTELPRPSDAETAEFVAGLPLSRRQPLGDAAVRPRRGVLHPQHGPRRRGCSCTAAVGPRPPS